MQLADRPDKLAAGFKKTLSGWRRSTQFYGYREAREFGRILDGWLDQVARELLPKDPPAALSLFEAFIEADAAWFDRADDSDGAIGDAVRAACRHWLQAAARCESPPGVWPERLLKLYEADQYGAREELLQRADLLLDEPALRGLVTRFESQLLLALGAWPRDENPPDDVFRISAALSLLSESLRDPDIMVRASLRCSPNPNPVQRQAFVQAYLDADRPADALAWLQEGWGHLDDSRQSAVASSQGRAAPAGDYAADSGSSGVEPLYVRALGLGAELLDPVFGARSGSPVRMRFSGEDPQRWVRAGIASPTALPVSLEPGRDIDRDAGIEAPVDTLDQVDEPGRACGHRPDSRVALCQRRARMIRARTARQRCLSQPHTAPYPPCAKRWRRTDRYRRMRTSRLGPTSL